MAHSANRKRRVTSGAVAVAKVMPTEKRYEIVLACEHRLYFGSPPPKARDRIYCRPCQHYQPVVLSKLIKQNGYA